MAGLRLHRLILENTVTCGRDQDHLNVIHLSLSERIPDRTDSLLAGDPARPAEGMASVMAAGEAAMLSAGLTAVAGIPCNTFHAPPIWKEFESELQEAGSGLSLCHMVDETIATVFSQLSPGSSVGILSTTGSRNLELYSGPLQRAGYKVLEPAKQERVHELIYNREWGIKAVIDITERARKTLAGEILALEEQGAGLIILGCTELPLAAERLFSLVVPLLDPMESLARALIRKADPGRLKG